MCQRGDIKLSSMLQPREHPWPGYLSLQSTAASKSNYRNTSGTRTLSVGRGAGEGENKRNAQLWKAKDLRAPLQRAKEDSRAPSGLSRSFDSLSGPRFGSLSGSPHSLTSSFSQSTSAFDCQAPSAYANEQRSARPNQKQDFPPLSASATLATKEWQLKEQREGNSWRGGG